MDFFRILVVEDEIIIAKDIKNTILQLDFDFYIEIVTSVNDVFRKIEDNQPQIIIMDIKLNDYLDGIEVIERIHQKFFVPVIYLTSFEDDEIIQRAVKTKPVSYLIKPFSRGELKSSILLALYKEYNVDLNKEFNEIVQIDDDYFYDIKNKRLYYKESMVKLGLQERNLLELLIRAKGSTVLFEDIELELWSGDIKISNSTNNAIRTLVYRLRKKLHSDIIESVPYEGFRVNLHKK